MFGLRLGNDPRVVATTTPKMVPLMRAIGGDPTTVVTRGRTYDNAANLAPAFLEMLLREYQGTRLGRQELMAEILDEIEADARRDYRPETLKYVIETLDEVRRQLGLDLSEDEEEQ